MNPEDFDIGILRRIEHSSNAIFWIFAIIGIITIILAKLNNNAYIGHLFNFSKNYNQQLFSPQSLSAPLLILNYLISLSLMIGIAINSIYNLPSFFSAKNVLEIFAFVCSYYFLKTLIQYLLSNWFMRKSHFDIGNAFKQYQVLGLILLPLSIFSIYQTIQFQYLIFVLGTIITIIVYIIQLYFTLKESLHYKVSLLYIILYLCTLEILPLFLIAKYLLS
ncbi:MAG: DUF4271 domain-containing protein [Crocinitomicaceae bacterium]